MKTAIDDFTITRCLAVILVLWLPYLECVGRSQNADKASPDLHDCSKSANSIFRNRSTIAAIYFSQEGFTLKVRCMVQKYASSTSVYVFGITYIAKVFIKQLYKSMDSLQCQQLIVMILYGTAEVQAGIPTNRREEKKE